MPLDHGTHVHGGKGFWKLLNAGWHPTQLAPVYRCKNKLTNYAWTNRLWPAIIVIVVVVVVAVLSNCHVVAVHLWVGPSCWHFMHTSNSANVLCNSFCKPRQHFSDEHAGRNRLLPLNAHFALTQPRWLKYRRSTIHTICSQTLLFVNANHDMVPINSIKRSRQVRAMTDLTWMNLILCHGI